MYSAVPTRFGMLRMSPLCLQPVAVSWLYEQNSSRPGKVM
jgi:hypothetical protein